jgi:hypothetical protein
MLVTHQPETIDFTIATLDKPDVVLPGFPTWRRSRIGWFRTDATLPRHERGARYHWPESRRRGRRPFS